MRLCITLQLLLALCFTTGLMAQGGTLSTDPVDNSDWFVEPLPEGHSTNEIIAHFPNPKFAVASEIEEDLKEIGIKAKVEQLDRSTVLINYLDGITSLKACKGMTENECLCHILGNPGGLGTQTTPDGTWPNYTIGIGAPPVFTPAPDRDAGIVSDPFLNNHYDPMLYCDADVDIPDVTLGDRSVDIAILDTGIETKRHRDFFSLGSGPIDERFSTFVRWHTVNDQYGDAKGDPHGHGTMVAYLAAHTFVNANKKDQITLHSYRVLGKDGTGRVSDVIKAIEMAIEQGVDIMNMSFGFKGIECDDSVQDLLSSHLAKAEENGILTFVSAGNDGNNLTSKPQFPAAENELTGTYTIGATTCGRYQRWEHSNFSRNHLDFMAPGTNIFVPFVTAPHPNSYILVDGTSFATPIAAGFAANLFSRIEPEYVQCLLQPELAYMEGIIQRDSWGGPINLNRRSCTYTEEPDSPWQAANIVLVYVSIHNPYNPYSDLDDILFGGIRPLNAPGGSASPNPFAGSVLVSTDYVNSENPAVISLLDANGTLIKRMRTTSVKTSLQTNELRAGIYYINVSTSKESETIRIIKQ